eukprot:m.136990 g.136990  ORF g.136990 m.136990 type:complete len:272 (-) comp15882_c0_seq3:347-1162(-)
MEPLQDSQPRTDNVAAQALQTTISQYAAKSAVGYKQSKLAPWRMHAERHTANIVLGNVNSQRVVDLACGEGHYTRWLKAVKGAKEVTGVDLSPDMIELAKRAEAEDPIGVHYLCQDAATLTMEPVDVVFAAFLLNYAPTYARLVEYCKAAAAMLPEGGRFVTVNNNPLDTACHHPELKEKYYVAKTCNQPGVDGAVINYTFFDLNGSELCSVDNYFFSAEAHVQALTEAGFKNIEFTEWKISEEELRVCPEGFWDAFLEASIIGVISAVKC